jgi:ribonuclease HI
MQEPPWCFSTVRDALAKDIVLDTLHFDGSCDPNPGGRLGFGWVLTLADTTQTSGRGEQHPAYGNTNNLGEYQGLIAGLCAYIDHSYRGPLLVIGDSQLIIGQVEGTMRAKDPTLIQQRDQAQALVARIPGGVTFRWERRDRNTAADALAGDGQSTLPPPAQRTYARTTQLATAPISAATRIAISTLNEHPAPGFKDFARLTVGGTDAFSSLKLPILIVQAGSDTITAVQAAFPDDPVRQAAALRWCLRGLAVELAIRKGQVDAILASQATKQRK